MSAQAVGVFGVGTEPPPDSTRRGCRVVIFDVSVSTLARSAWVIWPIFSASVMRDSRSWTRCGPAAPRPGTARLCVAGARGGDAAVPGRANGWRGDRHGGECDPRHGE